MSKKLDFPQLDLLIASLEKGRLHEGLKQAIRLQGEIDQRFGLQPIGTEALVCQEIASRQQMGINKYGTTVAENPLDLEQWLQHAYEETLDKAIYLRRAIQELQKGKTT